MVSLKEIILDWRTVVSKAVAEGRTKSQFAIPNGKYKGDLFFITDVSNKILIAFQWTGERWMHEHEVVEIKISESKTDERHPQGLKPVSLSMRIYIPNVELTGRPLGS